MTFDECVKIIIDHEGGYNNDKNDKGGETKFGISKRAYPNFDIPSLTRKHAELIYQQDYFNPIYGSQLPQEIRLLVFNCAVNCGVSFAVKTLQKIVGSPVDGKMGLITLNKLLLMEPLAVKKDYLAAQIEYYFSLNRPEFIKGWILRIVDISSY